MNIPLVIANMLTFLAFIVHTYAGDKELKQIQPQEDADLRFQKREKWTMARCAWHLVSYDLLFASAGLALINFSDLFDDEKTLLQILAFYFFGYAIAWALTIAVSRQFPKNYLKLGQWVLLLAIGGLIYWGL